MPRVLHPDNTGAARVWGTKDTEPVKILMSVWIGTLVIQQYSVSELAPLWFSNTLFLNWHPCDSAILCFWISTLVIQQYSVSESAPLWFSNTLFLNWHPCDSAILCFWISTLATESYFWLWIDTLATIMFWVWIDALATESQPDSVSEMAPLLLSHTLTLNWHPCCYWVMLWVWIEALATTELCSESESKPLLLLH